jgi:Holliday junction resolvase RusA-like endonuclease
MEYKFTVSGDPVAKGRPKFSTMFKCLRCQKFYRKQKENEAICPNCGSRKFFIITNARTPKKSSSFENLVQTSFSVAHGAVTPTELGVEMIICAYFLPPKATPKYRQKEIQETEVIYIKRPDMDNLIKSVFDGLNEVAYQDDKLIHTLTVKKRYSYRPRTEITVITEEELEKDELPF